MQLLPLCGLVVLAVLVSEPPPAMAWTDCLRAGPATGRCPTPETGAHSQTAPTAPPRRRQHFFSGHRPGTPTPILNQRAASRFLASMTRSVALKDRFELGPPNLRPVPAWSASAWAYLAYAMIVLGLLYGALRMRWRMIRARNCELEGLIGQRTAELVRANAAKDEFLAGVGHEIRNPLHAVIGLAASIDCSGLDPAGRERFTQLRHCATHLASLFEDLFDFCRMQSDAANLDPQPFAVHDLVASVKALCATESARTGIPLEAALAPAVPPLLVGDAPRLRQILLNYVVNALQYAGRGQVYLTVWCREGSPGRTVVTFAVTDDGPGIDPAEQGRLFTRFSRGAAARKRRIPGTGLGLALCKTLGEKMGGRLWVESELGRGSTFYLEIELGIAAAHPGPDDSTATYPSSAGPLLALVVDDEDYNRLALSALLEGAGFVVATAADADQALTAVLDRNFDVVFLDLRLAGENGLEVARQLRALPHVNPTLPVIATTALAPEDVRAGCLEAGMNGVVTKPVTLEKIRAAFAVANGIRPGLPTPAGEGDPLEALRAVASRKGSPLQAELMVFLGELEQEQQALIEAVRRHDPRASGAAHRLVGRLAYLRADAEVTCAREIEADLSGGYWCRAESALADLDAALVGLRERLVRTW